MQTPSCASELRYGTRVFGLVLIAGVVLMLAGCPPPKVVDPLTLPNDPQATCTVGSTEFAGWFQSGSVTLNGVVNPADSVHFSNNPNCEFYKWSKQMLLWLTSPAPPAYGGGGGRIFDSPAFFDVSPPAADGSRTFLPHTIGVFRNFSLRAAQVGPRGLQIVFDRAGRMLEVQPAEKGAKLQVRDAAGKLVEVEHARREKDGRLLLLDKSAKPIEMRPPQNVKIENRDNSTQLVRKFLIDGIPIFVDPTLSVIDAEQGQADDAVLQAQNGSLVYYVTIANDVFAYFATGTKDGGITPAPTQFPTSQAELDKITTFATAHGKTFPDPNALAVEVKSAWVEAAGLANLSSYITMTATIPTYDKTNPNQWTPNGQKTVQLALVGIHVVGSTAGHPEMIWATFEHFSNTPRATYSYINTSGATVSVPQNTAAGWLFAANGSTGPFNQAHMQFSSPNIVSVAPFSISPSDTMRRKPFGGASNVSPNPLDPSTAASNTEIISINNSVSGMIASGDIRNNYVMTGATWTIGGAAPSGSNQVGTSMLANTTMETYQQGRDTNSGNGSTNCFSCHTNNTTGVSHVFGALKPLF
jgi:hypothetical protein